MKKLSYLLSLLFVAGLCLQSPAATGLKMLSVEAGSRPAGMGGAFTAVSGDPYSAAYNPSATWGIRNLTSSIGYNSHWENTRIETGFISFCKKAVVVTSGIQFAAVDNMEGRQDATEDFVEFGAHDVSFKLGAAFELEENYYLGFALGYMYEKIDTYAGSAFNFDLGLLVRAFPDFNIGLAVLNFGSTINLRDQSYDLPTSYRGGVSYNYRNLLSSLDVISLDGDVYVNAGAEYEFHHSLFIRAGYRFGYDRKDFSAGAGFTRRNLRIDYAFLPYKEDLGSSHLINLTFQI
jgi:hypothetical protein